MKLRRLRCVGRPQNGPPGARHELRTIGFEDQFLSALTPFWDRPTHRSLRLWQFEKNGSLRGDENRATNNNVTSQSVTYVLSQMCYLCVDHTSR